jgi:hypothetical protein
MLRVITGIMMLTLGRAAGAAATEPAASRIPLSYDPHLVRADFVSPALRLTVGGKSAWFLIDTGAGVHLIASWLVKQAGLRVDADFGKEVSGVDSTGREMPFQGVRDLQATLADGGRLSLPIAAVTDFAPDFEQAGVAGALSPQLLAPAGAAATLDLRVPELRLEPFDSAVRRLGARVQPRERVEVCGSPSGPVPHLLFAIPVSARATDGSLLLDSGARVTKLGPKSPLIRGMHLESGGRTTGVTGAAQEFTVGRDLALGFAGYVARLDVRVARRGEGVCGRDGLIGLDALSACALVLGPRDVAIACDHPR